MSELLGSGLYGYGGLFLSALVAATIFPAQSEVVLTALLLAEYGSVFWLLVWASVGNVLGSVLNYGLGRVANTYADRWWFPANAAVLSRAEGWYRRYGQWSLLLSWAPFIGDPLTVVAGVLRAPLLNFLILVTLAKVGRYLVLTAVVLGIFGDAQ